MSAIKSVGTEGAVMIEIDDVEVTILTSTMFEVRSPGNGSSRKLKTFRGESAWSDAERYANDRLREVRDSAFGEFFAL